MAKKRTTGTLHLLTVRGVQAAGEGDHADGGGLLLRVRGASASWVLRYTGPTGRREMGLGIVLRGSPKQAGDSLTGARDSAHKARDLLRQRLDPISERDKHRDAARQVEATKTAEKARDHWTLCRAARDYHPRLRHSQPVARLLSWRGILSHGPGDAACPPPALGRGARACASRLVASDARRGGRL